MTEYEIGVDRGMLYVKGLAGEAWNGLTAVRENVDDSTEQTRYIDGVKNRLRRNTGSFSGVIEAYTYPDVFFDHVLTQRRRSIFDLSYRTMHGDFFYIHLVYNAAISPAGISRKQSETEPFSWGFTTTPVPVPDSKPSSHLIIDSGQTYSWTLEALENILYGSDTETPRLPLPGEVFDIFESNSILKVIDNGDGTYTVDGPDEAIQNLGSEIYRLTWPSVKVVDANTYSVRSL